MLILPCLLAALAVAQIDDPMAQMAAGRAAAASGDFAAATERLAQVAQAYPTWGLAQLELADVLLQASAETERIEAALTRARTLEPLNPRGWALTGRWCEGQGMTEAALEAYQRALELRPELQDCRERLGVLLAQLGRHAEAIPHLVMLLEAHPEERAARANLAEAYEQTGDLEGAERELRKLVEDAPESVAFRRRLALFYERIGQPEKARAEMESAGTPRPARKLRPLLPSRR